MRNNGLTTTLKLKSKNTTVFLMGLLLLCSPHVIASDKLFNDGISAYQKNDYINTVKYLYAYYELNNQTITHQSKQELLEVIRYSSDKIWVALKTKEALDKHGQVTEVVLESGGKMDDPNAKKTTRPFNGPADVKRKKPKPPKIKKKSKSEILIGEIKPELVLLPAQKSDPIPKQDTPKKDNKLKEKYANLIKKYERLKKRCNTKLSFLSEESEKQTESLLACKQQLGNEKF